MWRKCFQVLGMHVLSTDLVSLLDLRLICGQDGTWTTLLKVQKCGHICNTKGQFWLLGAGVDTVPGRHTWGGWWTHTVCKLLKDVSLYTNTLDICLRMQKFVQWNRCWCLLSTVTFLTNCEEIHNNLSNLNCRSHLAENCIVAMRRGLRQALARIGCLQALESGLTVEEPCPAEMADYDHVYYVNVPGASLLSEMC